MNRLRRFVGTPGRILSLALLALVAFTGLGRAWAQGSVDAADLAPAAIAAVRLVPVATGLASPTYATHAGDRSGRLFILFGDLCSGEVFALDNGQMSVLLDTGLAISSFGEDEAGEICVVDIVGAVYRIARA